MYRSWPVFAAVMLAFGALAWAAGADQIVRDGLRAANLAQERTGAPRVHETDRIARVVADAISWPRQSTADGLAGAALDTVAARDGRLQVVEATPLRSDDRLDPLARLTFRVHLDGHQAGFTTVPDVTYCYRAEFNSYGVIGAPTRVDCPRDAAPVTPPPAPAEVTVPVGADKVVERALRSSDVRSEVTAGVRRITRKSDLSPAVTVDGDGSSVGVAVSAPGTCLLGRRVSGKVEVWYLPPVKAQPGEVSCSPQSALAGAGQRSPH